MTTIKEIMSTPPDYVASNTPIASAAELMRDRDIGILPVAKDDRMIGMITDRDIVTRGVAKHLDLESQQVGAIMSEDVFYCREDDDMDAVAGNMAEQRIHRLPVVDKDKRLVGMVTIGDLAARGSAESAGLALSGVTG